MKHREDNVFLANFQRRLAQFVDRSDEMSMFNEVLANTDILVMVVSAETGMGKTSLLMRMVKECTDKEIAYAKVDWSSIKVYDFLAALREVCAALGAQNFDEFTKLADFYTEDTSQSVAKGELTVNLSGAPIQVANNMQMTGSAGGDIAAVVVKQLVIQRQDSPVSLQERRDKLTELFLQGLARVSHERQVVLFFSVIDKMPDHTHQWLWQGLLEPIMNLRIPHVRAVLLGQPRADNKIVENYQTLVATAELKPLAQHDIVAYLKKRVADALQRASDKPRIGGLRISPERLQQLAGMTEEEFQFEAARLLKNTGGTPGSVAAMVDIFLKSPAKPA